MDFDLRDSLLIIGPLFIIAILLHGYWRMRSNRNRIKMSLDKSFLSEPGEQASEEEDIDMLRAELPNGGARVRKIPQQTALEGEDETAGEQTGPASDVRAEVSRESDEDEFTTAETTASGPEPTPDAASSPPGPGERPEYFIVVYVTAVGEPFGGQQLLECLVEHDMQFGEMNIFHRYSGDTHTEFSLVNAVEPGTFDMNTIAALETPAISLFMRAHEQANPTLVFDRMIEVARALADEMGGEVKDESRSVLTPQTIEHSREKIRNYQLKYS